MAQARRGYAWNQGASDRGGDMGLDSETILKLNPPSLGFDVHKIKMSRVTSRFWA